MGLCESGTILKDETSLQRQGSIKEWKPNACSITALQYNISRRLFWVSNELPCSSVLLSAGQSLTEGEIPSFNSF